MITKLKRFILAVKKSLKKILYRIPSRLPTGLPGFEAFYQDVITTYDLPDMPSYKQALASMIMHLGTTTFYAPKRFFALSIKKAMANQTAYEVIQQIREREAEKAATPIEAKTPTLEPVA